jgi:RNA polymerase sigma-70 factor (ECF subfamily)
VPGVLMEAISGGASPEGTAESREVAEAVWRVLDGMPAEHREVLVLCELEERSGPEAAELLGIPLGTVKSRLRAAQRSFRQRMGEAPRPAEVA